MYTNLLQTLFPNSKRPLPPLRILVVMAYQANGGGNCSKGIATEQQSWRAPVLLIYSILLARAESTVTNIIPDSCQFNLFKGSTNIHYVTISISQRTSPHCREQVQYFSIGLTHVPKWRTWMGLAKVCGHTT